MDYSQKNSIPNYLLTMLSEEYGKSMIIKGKPGAGKTTFALQILENFMGKRNLVLLSTRIGDESLYGQFPWLKKYEEKIKILISSELFLAEIYKIDEDLKKSAAKLILSEFIKKRYVSRFFYKNIFKEKNSPELLKIYTEIESNLPNKSLVVIDSLEGLSNYLKVPENTLVYMIQKDIVETSDSDIIYVSEKIDPSQEDFIVDAVISMDSSTDEERIFRKIILNKLRGKNISFPVYPFTLSNGHLHIFSNIELLNDFHDFKIIPFKEGYFSSGIKQLDDLLGGGFRIGSLVNIEVDKEVPIDKLRIIRNPLFINAIMQGKGINHTPAPGLSFLDIKNMLKKYTDEESFHKYYINIDYTTSKSLDKNHIALGNMDTKKAYEIDKEATEEFSRKNTITISWVHYDILEYFYGPDRVLKILFDMLSMKRDINANTIALTKPGQKISTEITHISDYKFKLTTKDNVIFIYGIKPFTKYYSIEIDDEKGYPNIKLIPVT
ncbi:MAG: gas vesicle protein GvpD P-loop domain-containing protein [Thermoplasmata archaeon]